MKIAKNQFTNAVKKYITIGVVGGQERIGTTTQSLQIVLYLQLMGSKVCYVEMNKSNYIEQTKQLYNSVKYNEVSGKYTTNDIEMFKGGNLPFVIKANYDYIIKDYGNVENDFNKLSFLESDIQIIVVGAKPNEIFQTTECLRDKAYTNSKYIFSFVPKGDREDILEMMGSKSSDTFFATLNVYDPFVYNSASNTIFKNIIDG